MSEIYDVVMSGEGQFRGKISEDKQKKKQGHAESTKTTAIIKNKKVAWCLSTLCLDRHG